MPSGVLGATQPSLLPKAPIIGHDNSFALLKENSSQVFGVDYSDGYVACMGGEGALYSFTGRCLKDGGEFPFYTYAELPGLCAVRDKNNIEIAHAKGKDDTNFIGIAISIDGYCGLSFELDEGVDCRPSVTGFEIKKVSTP
jgi:hypothetical protein